MIIGSNYMYKFKFFTKFNLKFMEDIVCLKIIFMQMKHSKNKLALKYVCMYMYMLIVYYTLSGAKLKHTRSCVFYLSKVFLTFMECFHINVTSLFSCNWFLVLNYTHTHTYVYNKSKQVYNFIFFKPYTVQYINFINLHECIHVRSRNLVM